MDKLILAEIICIFIDIFIGAMFFDFAIENFKENKYFKCGVSVMCFIGYATYMIKLLV